LNIYGNVIRCDNVGRHRGGVLLSCIVIDSYTKEGLLGMLVNYPLLAVADGEGFRGELPDFPGIAVLGKTLGELRVVAEEVVRRKADECRMSGKLLPESSLKKYLTENNGYILCEVSCEIV
jgi:predicted RNase H-like HicB family nuclease